MDGTIVIENAQFGGTAEMPRSEYDQSMIRQHRPGLRAISSSSLALAIGLVAGFPLYPAAAQDSRSKTQSPSKPTSGKPDPKAEAKKATAPAAPGKPSPLAQFGDWSAYAAGSGKAKTCYALGQPGDRKPELKRDPAYLFVSTRPGESVRNEVSIVMGFDVKPNATPTAQLGSTSYELVAKGANLWLKNPANEGQFVEALRKSGRLVVKAPSARGNVTTDTYTLTGLAQALDRVQKECP